MILTTEQLARLSAAAWRWSTAASTRCTPAISATSRPRPALGLPVLVNVSSDRYVSRKHRPLLDPARARRDDRRDPLHRLRPLLADATRWTCCARCGRATTSRAPTGATGCRRTQLAICARARHRGRLPGHRDALLDGDPAALRRMIDAVVSHHMNPFRSGVARFNELLAEHLGVPFVVARTTPRELRCPLLSFKFSELGEADARGASRPRLARWSGPSCSCTSGAALPLELRLLGRRAPRAVRQPRDRARSARRRTRGVEELWTPGLIVESGAHRAGRRPRVHLRDGAQDPHGAIPPPARPAGRHRAHLRRPRLGRQSRDRRPARRRSSSSRRCTASSPSACTSSATSPTSRSCDELRRPRSSPPSSRAACARTTPRSPRRWSAAPS